jgi:hypothetical protein
MVFVKFNMVNIERACRLGHHPGWEELGAINRVEPGE